MMSRVIVLRHAQSEWNAKGLFTGWADPKLTELGEREAHRAAELIAAHGLHFDIVYSSVLQRAVRTAEIIVGEKPTELHQDWRLNERHYGALQGLNKAQVASQYSEAQVWRWRRGYRDTPPALSRHDDRHPKFDAKYQHIDDVDLPSVENLVQTRARAMSFWQEHVVPELQRDKTILIAAHGNTLRALIMALSGMSEADVETFEIPTAKPIELQAQKGDQHFVWRYLEGDRHAA